MYKETFNYALSKDQLKKGPLRPFRVKWRHEQGVLVIFWLEYVAFQPAREILIYLFTTENIFLKVMQREMVSLFIYHRKAKNKKVFECPKTQKNDLSIFQKKW